nr:MAG TPA: Scaffold protein [Microviridae sp.]
MAYRSVSNYRETATAKPTEAGESVRRTYLWERDEKGEKVLRLDQTIDQQAEIDSYLEETKLENIIRRASIDPNIAERIAPDLGGGIQDFTEMPQTLAELQNIMIRAEQIWDEVPKEIKLKFNNDVDNFVASFGTVEWAKNLGIYEEKQADNKTTKATEATEAKE